MSPTSGLPSNIHLLGLHQSRLTVYSQQCRAFNLIAKILPDAAVAQQIKAIRKDRGSRSDFDIAVIGGGIAGLTAAVAAAVRGQGTVYLLERQPYLLHLQRGNHTRWLHPHLYDWPKKDCENTETSLPFLNWRAGTAGDVAEQLLNEFATLQKHCGLRIQKVTNANNVRIDIPKDRSSNAWKPIAVSWNRVDTVPDPHTLPGVRAHLDEVREGYGQHMFSHVIVATGFGSEIGPWNPTPSYWRNDDFDQPELLPRAGRRHILVSGTGDGGIVDVLRFRIAQFEHKRIVDDFFPTRDIDIQRLLHDVERIRRRVEARHGSSPGSKLKAIESGSELLNELNGLQRNPTCARAIAKVDARLKHRLRTDTKVTLNGQSTTPIRLDTSLLNTFLLWRLLNIDISYCQGDLNTRKLRNTIDAIARSGQHCADKDCYLKVDGQHDSLIPIQVEIDLNPNPHTKEPADGRPGTHDPDSRHTTTVSCDRLVLRHGAKLEPTLRELSQELHDQYVEQKRAGSSACLGIDPLPEPPDHGDFIVHSRWRISATHASKSLEKLGFSASSTELRNRWIKFGIDHVQNGVELDWCQESGTSTHRHLPPKPAADHATHRSCWTFSEDGDIQNEKDIRPSPAHYTTNDASSATNVELVDATRTTFLSNPWRGRVIAQFLTHAAYGAPYAGHGTDELTTDWQPPSIICYDAEGGIGSGCSTLWWRYLAARRMLQEMHPKPKKKTRTRQAKESYDRLKNHPRCVLIDYHAAIEADLTEAIDVIDAKLHEIGSKLTKEHKKGKPRERFFLVLDNFSQGIREEHRRGKHKNPFIAIDQHFTSLLQVVSRYNRDGIKVIVILCVGEASEQCPEPRPRSLDLQNDFRRCLLRRAEQFASEAHRMGWCSHKHPALARLVWHQPSLESPQGKVLEHEQAAFGGPRDLNPEPRLHKNSLLAASRIAGMAQQDLARIEDLVLGQTVRGRYRPPDQDGGSPGAPVRSMFNEASSVSDFVCQALGFRANPFVRAVYKLEHLLEHTNQIQSGLEEVADMIEEVLEIPEITAVYAGRSDPLPEHVPVPDPMRIAEIDSDSCYRQQKRRSKLLYKLCAHASVIWTHLKQAQTLSTDWLLNEQCLPGVLMAEQLVHCDPAISRRLGALFFVLFDSDEVVGFGPDSKPRGLDRWQRLAWSVQLRPRQEVGQAAYSNLWSIMMHRLTTSRVVNGDHRMRWVRRHCEPQSEHFEECRVPFRLHSFTLHRPVLIGSPPSEVISSRMFVRLAHRRSVAFDPHLIRLGSHADPGNAAATPSKPQGWKEAFEIQFPHSSRHELTGGD